MKAKINGIEVEGTPSEMAELVQMKSAPKEKYVKED
jgi:hypothetical protein